MSRASLAEQLSRLSGGRRDGTLTIAPAEPMRPQNFHAVELTSNPPQPAITERGTCESCGEPFTSTRDSYRLRYRGVSAKRFCSERCRKREETRRSRA